MYKLNIIEFISLFVLKNYETNEYYVCIFYITNIAKSKLNINWSIDIVLIHQFSYVFFVLISKNTISFVLSGAIFIYLCY